MACAVANWPTIGVSTHARLKWPAADCKFTHYDLAVILLFLLGSTALCPLMSNLTQVPHALTSEIGSSRVQDICLLLVLRASARRTLSAFTRPAL